MSLNNLSLSPQLLADLYPNVLVQGTASAVPVKEAVSFLGDNKKNILVVADKVDAPYLPDNELAFLTKVLAACQLGLGDVAIVNWRNVPEKNPQVLLTQFKPKQVMLFALAPSIFGLPAEMPFFAINTLRVVQYVAAPSLSEIEKNETARRKLWASLKILFCL